ncbi:hypothetical protein YC2023_035573 [Brassica napus]
MMILIQNNQALVWLKKGIGDNTHFVTTYRKKRLCISGVRRTRHHRNHIDVNIFGIVTYKIIAGLRTLKRMKRFFWKGSNYFMESDVIKVVVEWSKTGEVDRILGMVTFDFAFLKSLPITVTGR